MFLKIMRSPDPIDYLTTDVELTSIANAIRAKGGTSAQLEYPSEFITAIENIPTTAAEEKDVNFIDYDGTIIYSYTASDFANLTAMPANPSHTGLTAQGWNWTLANAKTYVASYGKLWIGQMYVTNDGKTRIYIKLEDGRLAPYLGIAINGSADVDWGDGSAHNTVTGSSTSTIVNTQHTYAAAGEYVIAISVTGSMVLFSDSSYGSKVLWKNSSTVGQNRAYQNAIQKFEIGSNCSIGDKAFCYCFSLASITIPSSVTSIGEATFSYCYSLTSITIPSSVASIDTNSFQNCHSLMSITIPSSVTSIGETAFSYCYSLTSITIPSSVTSIDTSAFQSCYSLTFITIPSNVTSIDTNSFSGCYSLASIMIPSDITSISNNTFYYCYSLASVTIPSNVTSIGTKAFNSCYCLGFITFLGTTPPSASSSNWYTSVPTDCIVYIPGDTSAIMNSYLTATNYPSSSTYTYVGYATFASGASLPSNYGLEWSFKWYATKEEAIAGTGIQLNSGTGNKIYCAISVGTGGTGGGDDPD